MSDNLKAGAYVKEFTRARRSWSNQIIPPLMVVLVIASVWYALQSRPAVPLSPPTSHATNTSSHVKASAVANPQPVVDSSFAPMSPVVHKQKDHLEFSVDTAPIQKVQKVEFYVEQQFVGAAYSQPYAVTVREADLSAGSHTVVAKIFTDSGTKQSKPAAFTAAASSVVTPPAETTIPTPSPSQPPAQTVPVPQNLAVTAAADGTSATLNWDAVAGATGYQVWRDGNLIASPTGTGYSDTGLNPGQTYDYTVVTVADTSSSVPSDAVAVTMPDPHVLGDSTTSPGFADQSAGAPDQSLSN